LPLTGLAARIRRALCASWMRGGVFRFKGSAMDDNRMPPADQRRDFNRAGGYVTQEQMHGEVVEFRKEMQAGFTKLELSIREARAEAVSAHERMREDWQLLLKDSIEHGARLNQVDVDMALTVSKDQFEPVKLLVYGVVGLMLTGVIGALLVLVLRKP
jgi:hypothetical protein